MRYVVLYHAPLAVAERYAQATAEEAQRGLRAWMDWADKLGPALLDPGKPFGRSQVLTADGVRPGGTDIVGMSIIEASSMENATEMVRNHHHLTWFDDCTITVLEETAIPELSAKSPGRSADLSE